MNKKSAFCAQVYFPNLEVIQPFTLEFTTNPSIWDTQNEGLKKRILKVSYDGVTPPINCSVCPSGVYIYKKFDFGFAGFVSCRATYEMMVEGRMEQIVQVVHTDIEISETEGDLFTPILHVDQLVRPSYNSPRRSPAPVIQLIYPTQETPWEMDYSIATEQMVKGHKYPGFKGNSRDTYCKGFNQQTPITLLANENRGFWAIQIPTPNVECIVSFEGCYKVESGLFGSLLPFKDMMVYCEYTNGNIVVGGRMPLDQVNKNLWVVGVVKYTKV